MAAREVRVVSVLPPMLARPGPDPHTRLAAGQVRDTTRRRTAEWVWCNDPSRPGDCATLARSHVADPPRNNPMTPDRLYLDLKGARERLCRAQVHVPAHWRDDLDRAVTIVDTVASAVALGQWSRHDQPDYPGPRS